VQHFAYIPFGAGSRVCMGKHLGLLEATLLFAMVAQSFRLRVPEGVVIEPLGRMTLRPHARDAAAHRAPAAERAPDWPACFPGPSRWRSCAGVWLAIGNLVGHRALQHEAGGLGGSRG